jgi:hypothetical protein
MKTSLRWLLAAAASANAAPALGPNASGTYSCTYQLASPCSSGTASVELLEGRLQKVSFESTYCTAPGNAGNRCTLRSARGGKDKWSETGNSVLIGFFDPRYPQADDEFKFILEAGRLVLDFSDTQTFIKCGMGAELPERVVIDPADAHCRVAY